MNNDHEKKNNNKNKTHLWR